MQVAIERQPGEPLHGGASTAIPVQTQLYFIERILGALIAVIYEPIELASTMIIGSLYALSINLSIVGEILYLSYLFFRLENQSLILRLLGLLLAPVIALIFFLVAIILESLLLIVAPVMSLPLGLLYALTEGYLKGIRGFIQDRVTTYSDAYRLLSTANKILYRTHLINQYWWSGNRLESNKLIVAQMVDALSMASYGVEKTSSSIDMLYDFVAINVPDALPQVRALQLYIKTFKDFCEMLSMLSRALLRGDIDTTQAQKVFDYCNTMQLHLLHVFIDNIENIELGAELEQFVLQQSDVIDKLKSAFGAVLDNQANSSSVFYDMTSNLLNSLEDIKENNLPPNINDASPLARNIWIEAHKKAWVRMKQNSLFDDKFVLKQEEIETFRHTRLTDLDKVGYRQVKDDKVDELLKQYEAIEDKLNETCPICLVTPDPKNKIVLIKQFKSDETWLPIPNHSNKQSIGVFDRDSLKGLVKVGDITRIIHPLNRDPFFVSTDDEELLAPNSYDSHLTRYRCHPYYQNPDSPDDNFIYSQELESIAQTLKQLVPVKANDKQIISPASMFKSVNKGHQNNANADASNENQHTDASVENQNTDASNENQNTDTSVLGGPLHTQGKRI